MSLKERLFGPQWESKDAAVRARAVSELNDSALFDRLPAIAADDPDPTVRMAALRRMNHDPAWLKARAEDSDETIRAAADHYLARVVCEREGGDTLGARVEWLKSLDDSELVRKLARAAMDEPLRRAAIARIDSPGFLGDMYCEESSDAIAEEVLARIDQVSTLRRIADRTRKMRKKRHQAVVRRLASLEGDDGAHSARHELAGDLIKRAEELARGQGTGDRKTRADELQARWDELDSPDEAESRRFDGAMKIVRAALAPRPARLEPEPVQVESADTLEPLVESVKSLASNPPTDSTSNELDALTEAFEDRWAKIDAPGETDHRMQKHFRALVEEVRAHLAVVQAARVDQAPKEAPPPPPEPRVERAPDPELFETLQTALETADQAIESGDIARSNDAVSAARSAHDRIPVKHRPRDVSGRLSRMAGKLKEMRDWQHWSNNKLRERLIERVDEIDVAELHPDAVTARLKELRERWRELDEQEVLPNDKRRFSAPQGQWRRFQKACNDKFEAARPYLEKRTEVREESLTELKDFLTDAQAKVDDESAPRDTLIRYQRAAREAIRNLDAVPPKARGKMAARLRALMDALSARLEEKFEAVENEKRRLVAEAKKLIHEKDRAVAIDRAKALQAEWKKAGRARRKVDEALWNEFREPIDPLFEDLKKEQTELKQAEHEQMQLLKNLCEKAEALVSGDESELEAAAGPLAGLEGEFSQHSRIPPALRKRFDKALSDYRGRLRALHDARQAQQRAHLDALAETLQATWTARSEGKEPKSDALPEVPEDDALGKHLQGRLAEFSTPDASTEALAERVERCTEAARQVVIELECLSGLETPEQDKKLRMTYQISRLSSRLGEGAARPDLDSERADLEKRWLESFPHDPESHAGLVKRYNAAIRILHQMTSQ